MPSCDCYIRSLDDEKLVLMAKDGDENALRVLMEKYQPLVRNKASAYFLAGADSDDIIQEGMIGLYKAVCDFDCSRQASFASFAVLCVTRQIISAVKKAARQKHLPLNNYVSFDMPGSEGDSDTHPLDIFSAETVPDPETLFIVRENIEAVKSFMEEVLTGFEKEVFKLYMVGKSYNDISNILSKPVKSIDNALQRVKKKLMAHINMSR